jgi:hypothetical protein
VAGDISLQPGQARAACILKISLWRDRLAAALKRFAASGVGSPDA